MYCSLYATIYRPSTSPPPSRLRRQPPLARGAERFEQPCKQSKSCPRICKGPLPPQNPNPNNQTQKQVQAPASSDHMACAKRRPADTGALFILRTAITPAALTSVWRTAPFASFPTRSTAAIFPPSARSAPVRALTASGARSARRKAAKPRNRCNCGLSVV